ncbi:MlaD family protein [Robiginitomaculum antarcticum]|uniref:MlaD family protein n=1 Tax=Robiginitomaculum antarcticum TaxID=437507 RepID=UPI00036FF05D|nr:MlaD family protein [Robiginitomaculum antarcticum]
MESRAHFALIGTFVMLAATGILAMILWLSGAGPNQEFDEYIVTFDGPVRGIQESAEVRFQGIKVGEVTSIRLDPDNPNKVLVRIEVFKETPIDVKSYAQLEPQGLTGLSFVQLTAGGGNFALLKDQPGRGPYFIEGRGSQLDSLLAGGGDILEMVQRTLSSVQNILSDEAVVNFNKILDNVEVLTRAYRETPLDMARVNTMLESIDQAAKDVSVASVAVDETARDAQIVINDVVKPLTTRLEKTLEEVDKTILAYREVAGSANTLLVNADGTLARIDGQIIRDLELAVIDMRSTLQSISRLTEEIERNPSMFLSGKDRERIKVPQ